MNTRLRAAAILACFLVSGAANAQYSLMLSASDSDPEITYSATPLGFAPLYLWATCAKDGLAALEAEFHGSMAAVAFSPSPNVLSVSEIPHLLLAVGGCPTPPLLLGTLWVSDPSGGSIGIGAPSGEGLFGAVDCTPVPSLHTMRTVGFASAGHVVPVEGMCTSCEEIVYGTWAGYCDSGLDDQIRALTTVNGTTYAGGDFPSWGDVPLGYIAERIWNGWQPLLQGVNGPVRALASFQGDLVAAGTFTMAGSVAANRIARWDGSEWTTFGNGIDGEVRALSESPEGLVAGGDFHSAGGSPARHVARWNGSDWEALDAGVDGVVNAATVWSNSIVVGGMFQSAGGAPSTNIARWTKTGWTPLGQGLEGEVLAVTVLEGQLVAGGRFTQSGAATVRHLARWTGSQWEELGGGVDGEVLAFGVNEDGLYVGGRFTEVGGRSASAIALYRPASSDWELLAGGAVHTYMSGIDPSVSAITPTYYAGYRVAYVGGDFHAVGKTPSDGFAAHAFPIALESAPAAAKNPTRFQLGAPYPVPSSKGVRLSLELSHSSLVQISVHDVSGRRIRNLGTGLYSSGLHVLEWDGCDPNGRRLPTGIYLIRVEAEGEVASRRVIRSR